MFRISLQWCSLSLYKCVPHLCISGHALLPLGPQRRNKCVPTHRLPSPSRRPETSGSSNSSIKSLSLSLSLPLSLPHPPSLSRSRSRARALALSHTQKRQALLLRPSKGVRVLYVSNGALVGVFTVLLGKAASELLILSFGGENQLDNAFALFLARHTFQHSQKLVP